MKKNENQIAITGATGHLGHCVLQELLQKGKSVNALYRGFRPQLEHVNLTWIKGDINDQTAIDLCTRNASVIIHCASLISVGNNSKEDVYNVNFNGTKVVIEACLKNKVRLIYISSSTAVKETLDDDVFTENRPFKTQSDFSYEWTKSISEQLILKTVENENLDAIIIRPTAIVGPPDYRPSYFGQTVMDLVTNRIPVTISGGYNLVDVRDLSQTIVNSIDMGKSGEIYLVGGTYFKIKQIALLLNPNRRVFSLSLDVLLVLLPVVRIYERYFTLKWLITKESLLTLKRAPKNVDSSKAIEGLNHQIRPVTETVTDLITWFKKEN